MRALYHWARQLEGKCFEALSSYAQNRKAKRLDVERAFYERARATESKAAADLVETTRSRPEPRWAPDVADDNDARWTATFLLPRDAPPRSIPSPPNTPSPVKIRPPPKRRAAPRPLPPDVVLLGAASMPPVARAAPDDDGEASLAPTARRPPALVTGRQRHHRSSGRSPPPSSDPAAVDVLVQALARAVGELRAPEAGPPPLLRPTTLEGTPPPPPPSLRSARSHRSASSRGSRRSRRSSQRREAQGEVTVLEHRRGPRAGEGRVAAPRPPPRGAARRVRRVAAGDGVRRAGLRGAHRGDRVLFDRGGGVVILVFFSVARVRVSGRGFPAGIVPVSFGIGVWAHGFLECARRADDWSTLNCARFT